MTSRASARADVPARAPWFTRSMLRLVHAVAPRLQRLGVEPDKFVALVELRFELDRRAAIRQESGRFVLALGAMLLVSALVSVTIAMFVCIVDTAPAAVAVLAGALEIMLPMLLIGAWIDVLLDGASESVLGCRPLDDRTLLASRLGFLLTYATSTLLALVALPLVAGSIRHGPWPFLPAASIAVATASALAIFGMLVAFLLLARIVPADRFRTWVLRVQFTLAIAMPISFQFAPRLVDHARASWPEWLALAFPPSWSRSVADLLDGRVTPTHLVSGLLSFSVPITLGLLALRLARGRYAAATLAPQMESRDPARGTTHGLARFMQRVATSRGERAAFDLARLLTMRERTYLVRTLPALLSIAAPLMAPLLLGRTGAAAFDVAALVALAPMLLAFGQPALAMCAQCSETPAAAWIFASTPGADARTLRFGTAAALLSRWCLVPSAFCICVATALGGPVRGLLALLVGLVALHLGVVAFRSMLEDEPFTRPYTAKNQQVSRLQGFMMLYAFGSIAVGVALYVLRDQWIVLACGTLVLCATARPAWNTLRE